MEVISTVGQVFSWPGWLVQSLVVGIFIGLPVAIAVSWMFDLTPEGFLPDSNASVPTDATGLAATEGASTPSSVAVAEAADGHSERAVTIAAAAEVLADQAGVVIVHAMGIGAGDQIEALRGTFDEESLARLTEAGRTMSPAEVVTMVTSGEAPAPAGALSP